MVRKNILSLTMASPPYIDLLERLHRSGKFNLIVGGELSRLLARRNVPSENLEPYMSEISQSGRGYSSVQRILEALPKVFNNESFQKQFTIDQKCFFSGVGQDMFDHLRSAIPDEIFLIEVFQSLCRHRKISLVMQWTDVTQKEKTLTLAAQANNVPVLQLLHGGIQGRKIGHRENKIYADKVTNLAPNSKDFFSFYGRDDKKMVVTGRVEFDYAAIPPSQQTRERACAKLGLDPKKPVVVFGTTYLGEASAWYREGHNLLHEMNVGFMEAFARLKKLHQDLQLLIKVHPNSQPPWTEEYFYGIAAFAGIDDVLVTKEHIQEALVACDLLVTCYKSTICVDGILLDKPVVVLDLFPASDFLVFEEQAMAFVRNPDDTFRILSKALFDQEFRDELESRRERSKYYFNYLNDGKAKERIISVINEMVE